MKKLFLILLLACSPCFLAAQSFSMTAGTINQAYAADGYPAVIYADESNVFMYQLHGVSIDFLQLDNKEFTEKKKTTVSVIDGKDAENGYLIDVKVVGKKMYVIYRVYDYKGEVVKLYGAIYDKAGKQLKKELIEKYECNLIEFIFGFRVRYSNDNKRILFAYEPFNKLAFCFTHIKSNVSCDDQIKNRNQNKQVNLLVVDKDFEKVSSFEDVLEVNEEHVNSINYLVTDQGKIFYYYHNDLEEGDERYILRIYDLKSKSTGEGEDKEDEETTADITQDISLGIGKKFDFTYMSGLIVDEEDLFLAGIYRKSDEYGIYNVKINGKTGDVLFKNKEKIADDVTDKMYVDNIGRGISMGAKDLMPMRLKMLKDSTYHYFLEQRYQDCAKKPCKNFYYDAVLYKFKKDGKIGGMRHIVRRQAVKGDVEFASYIPYMAKDSIHFLYYEDLGNFKESNIAKGKVITLKKISKGAFSSLAVTKSKFKGGNKQVIALPKELQGFKIVNNYLYVMPDKSFIMVARKGKTYRMMRFVYKG